MLTGFDLLQDKFYNPSIPSLGLRNVIYINETHTRWAMLRISWKPKNTREPYSKDPKNTFYSFLSNPEKLFIRIWLHYHAGRRRAQSDRWVHCAAFSPFQAQYGGETRPVSVVELQQVGNQVSCPATQGHTMWQSCVNPWAGWTEIQIIWQLKQPPLCI